MFEVSHGHFFEIFYNLDMLTGWGLYGNDVEWKALNADQVEKFSRSLAIARESEAHRIFDLASNNRFSFQFSKDLPIGA